MALLASAAIAALGQTSVTTYHNDNLRTGLNSAETVLTPSTVTPASFGLLFTLPVDGQVYAQPLYLPSVTVPGKGVHNVVFVCTEHNSVYAFDADSNTGANASPLWHVNFGASIPYWETGTTDINPEIGITSTPVIASPGKPAPLLLYVVSKTRNVDGNGNPYYTQALHALNVSTGAEQLGGPVVIQGTVPGTGEGSVNGKLTFDPLIHQSRAALVYVAANAVLLNGAPSTSSDAPTVHVSFASHGDNGPYHGWIFTYNASTLKLLGITVTTPNAKTDPSGYPIAAGGVWQGGAGPASDGTSLFFSTGNGTYDLASKSFGDSIVRVPIRTPSIVDWFTPVNQYNLDISDADLGSGGAMLLPAEAGSRAHPHLLVQSGKEGTVYLLDRTQLGHYGAAVQELPYVMGGIWGAPAYFNGNVYFGPVYSSLVAFPIKNGQFTQGSPAAYTPTYFAFPGPTPSVSSNGSKNGIVWAIQADAFGSGPAILHAYDANNVATQLYSSDSTAGRDQLDVAVKFTVPTVVNGKVFVGTASSVGVFGIGQWAATPTVTPDSGSYFGALKVTMSDPTPGSSIFYTTNGSTPTQASSRYSAPLNLSSSTTLKVRAFAAGYGASPTVEKDYLLNPVIGSGTGLTGNYYDNSQNPSGTPTATRIDPTINFNWNGGSPIANVQGTNWAGEWTGNIQAETTGTYTIYTNSDDGVQVYINGQLLINNYTYHAPTWDSATINFVAGGHYSIDIKFFQGGGGSVLQLYWASSGLPFQVVPKSQLYPGRGVHTG